MVAKMLAGLTMVLPSQLQGSRKIRRTGVSRVRSSRHFDWFILGVCLFLASCRIVIEVPEGGEVRSDSGAYNCAAFASCEVDIVDTRFSETFTAVPAEGYEFIGWGAAQPGYLCGGKLGECSFSTVLFDALVTDNPGFAQFFSNQDIVFKLNPSFGPEDPGRSSEGTLHLASGWLADKAVSTADWEVEVDPGAPLAGFITLSLLSDNLSEPYVFGFSPDWEARTSPTFVYSGIIEESGAEHEVGIDLTAPTEPGEYYIVFAFMHDVRLDQLFAAELGNSVFQSWNDGNDLNDIEGALLESSREQGFVNNWRFTDGDFESTRDVPLAAIKIVVRRGDTGAPDLQAGSLEVGSSTVSVGNVVVPTATFYNMGSAPAENVLLTYYASADAVITPEDDPLGSTSQGTVEVDVVRSVSGSVELPVGNHYLGFCLAPVIGEQAVDNNCSAGVEVSVTGTLTESDLYVETQTVAFDKSATPGTLSVAATIRNEGPGASEPSMLRFYQSIDRFIPLGDTPFATVQIPTLGPGGSVRLAAESSGFDGDFYAAVCIDVGLTETNRDNNCSGLTQVRGGDLAGADLVVSSFELTPDPESAGTYLLSAEVGNLGTWSSSGTQVSYYRSEDTSLGAEDFLLATSRIGGVSPGGSYSEEFPISIPEGVFYVGLCVGTVEWETNSANNCSAATQVTGQGDLRAPDLVVDYIHVPNSTPQPDQDFGIDITVRNAGNATSAMTAVRFARSTDPVVTAGDPWLDSVTLAPLEPGESLDIQGVGQLPEGSYYVAACILDQGGESNASNNCSNSVPVTGTVPAQVPDIYIDRIYLSDSAPLLGEPFRIYLDLRNQGPVIAEGATVQYFRSNDARIDASDTKIGESAVGVINPQFGQQVAQLVEIPDGEYYVGACVLDVPGELNTANNCSRGLPVSWGYPDLEILDLNLSDAMPGAYEPIEYTVSVSNSGNGKVDGYAYVNIFLSSDQVFDTADRVLASEDASYWDAGTSLDFSRSISWFSLPEGTYYFGACIDYDGVESSTANNCRFDGQLTVTRTAPQIVSMRLSDDTPPAASPFTIDVQISNTGQASANYLAMAYFRSDDPYLSGLDRFLLYEELAPLAPDAGRTESALLYVPAGGYFIIACLREVMVGGGLVSETCEAINVTGSGPDPGPDYYALSTSVVYSGGDPAGQFRVQARFYNDGALPAASTEITAYIADNPGFSGQVNVLGGGPVPPIPKGTHVQVYVTTDLPDGVHYVRLCADVPGDSHPADNCSAPYRWER